MKEGNSSLTFKAPPHQVIENFLTGQPYRLIPASAVLPKEELLHQITDTCREPAIYKYLFEQKFGGRRYEQEDAQRFMEWAEKGWANQTHFVFLIFSDTDTQAAAIDIKSPNREFAEIGYWCSNKHRGIMTNSLIALTEVARQEGFRSLFAKVRNDNPASIGVLTRAGFTHDENWNEDPIRSRYTITLTR